VPKIAPLLFGEPIISPDFGVSLTAIPERKSDLASKFKISNNKASDVSVFGLIKNE